MEQNHEFEEMKRQLELLKEKLDRQTIINDKMLRGKLKNVSRTINYSAYATLLIALVMTPITYVIFNRELQLPLYLWVTLTVIMFAGTVADHVLRRSIRDIQQHDLTAAGQELSRFRRRYLRYEMISFVIAIAFFALFIYELAQRWQFTDLTKGLIFMAIGIIAGIVINLRFFKQMSELQKQIEETRD